MWAWPSSIYELITLIPFDNLRSDNVISVTIPKATDNAGLKILLHLDTEAAYLQIRHVVCRLLI